MKARVLSIFIYPIKSMQGVALSEVELTSTGLYGDRKYMLIDAEGRFISQRSHSILAQFQVQILGQDLLVQRGGEHVHLKPDDFRREPVDVCIWEDACQGHPAIESVNTWFSEQLNEDVRLVEYVSGSRMRKKNSPFETQFPDGYPVLVTNSKRLDSLNAALEKPVPMGRFRPNLVLEFPDDVHEFETKNLSSTNVILKNQKPCERCKVITLDQESGEFQGKEVLSQLVDVEKKAALFGINCTVVQSGKIREGDIFILE